MGFLLCIEEVGHPNSVESFYHFMFPSHLGDQVIKAFFVYLSPQGDEV